MPKLQFYFVILTLLQWLNKTPIKFSTFLWLPIYTSPLPTFLFLNDILRYSFLAEDEVELIPLGTVRRENGTEN